MRKFFWILLALLFIAGSDHYIARSKRKSLVSLGKELLKSSFRSAVGVLL